MSKSRSFTRRDFLKASAQTGLLLAAGHPLVYPAGKAWGAIDTDPPLDLAVVTGDPEKAVLKALDLLGGMQRFVKKGQKVAADVAATLGEGLQAFCIPGSVAYERKVGLGHGNLASMPLLTSLNAITPAPLTLTDTPPAPPAAMPTAMPMAVMLELSSATAS